MIITYLGRTYRIIGILTLGLLLQQTDGPGLLIIGQVGDVWRAA